MSARAASPALRSWSVLVQRYGSEGDRRLVARAFRGAVTVLVVLLARVRGVRFPGRTTGGWHWGPRWRLEWLLSWNEAGSVSWLRGALPWGGCFLDLGAHVGYYARLAADVAGPQGRVLAVEPHPENLRVLTHNVARRPQVQVVPAAVADHPGRLQLWESAGSSNHSLHQGFTGSVDGFEVDVVVGDDLVGAHGLSRVDVVKVDVEGGEPAALRGLEGTLRRFRPALLVERNPRALTAAGSSVKGLLALLAELGYDAFEVDDDGSLRPTAPAGSDADKPTANLVCLPRPRPAC